MAKFKHVCIIDDDPIYTFATGRLMEMGGFADYIEIFKNGKDALDALKPRVETDTKVPNVIFLDLNMPIMDGWEFLDEFMNINTEKILIYILTSSIDPSDFKKAKQYSSKSEYFVKPVTAEELKKLLDAI